MVINGLYNKPSNGFRSRPPLELLCQIGYLLIVPLSILINNTDALPWQTYFYLFLFSMQSHLMDEGMDVVPDSESGRKTTATSIGVFKTKFLIISIVMVEVAFLAYYFKEYIFSGVLALGLIWLLLDVFLLFKNKSYSLFEMKLFAFGSNEIAFITAAYVWNFGCLLKIG